MSALGGAADDEERTQQERPKAGPLICFNSGSWPAFEREKNPEDFEAIFRLDDDRE